MTNVESLFNEYRLAVERGERPDPESFLGRARGRERLVLELLIERHLEDVQEPRRLDPQAFEAALGEPWLRAVGGAVEPVPLATARERAGLSLSELAARVLAAAGVARAGEPQAERAALYLRRVERGELDPRTLAARAREALRAVLGVELAPGPRPATLFRLAGEPAGEPIGEAAARAADGIDLLARALETPAPGRRDEIDELFLGG